MPHHYSYQALTQSGSLTRGLMQAENEEELAARLREQGQYLVRARKTRRAKVYADGPISDQDLTHVIEYLATSLEAGIPLLQVLTDLENRLPRRRIRKIVAEIRTALLHGEGLSDAMAHYPKAFSKLVVSTVKAGETTGRLDFALRQLLAYLDWVQEIRVLIRQATTYPAIVVTGLVVLLVTLMTVLFPKILPVLESFQVALPLPTRMTIGAARFLERHWAELAAGLVGLGALLWVAARTTPGRKLIDSALLRLPVIGPVVLDINMARLVTYLSLCYATGVGVLGGLRLIEEMIGNSVLARAVARARVAIERGASIAQAFVEQNVFPTIVTRSLALGESTGRLDEALQRVKLYYDRELPARVRRLLSLLNPALVVILGAVILIVGLAIILPIMNIYQSLGR
ncbi:MAG: MSHA biogenesis protein MshG [Gemmatimonadales bacterium]|nr:MAG: MSHA biogenesis protein MshG [Gemmatimonadales bacterium]